MPAQSNPSAESLTSLIRETVGDSPLRVEESLGDGYVRLLVAEAERRQAVHDIRHVEDAVIEVLRNSRDAGARHALLAMAREGDVRTIVVLDDGEGIPEGLHERVFEARVTSKLESMSQDRWGVHGRGMALFSIRQNALESRVAASAQGGGTSLLMAFDASRLPERADQSSWPVPEEDAEGRLALKGPHNIIRTCCEVALEAEGLEVYVGSPSEMVACACALAEEGEVAPHSLIGRLGACDDAVSLRDAAFELGLEMSERTAHRILAGEIAAAPEAARCMRRALAAKRGRSAGREVDLHVDRRSLRIAKADMRRFEAALKRDFSKLGESYYIRLLGDPSVSVGRGKMTVTFEFENED